VSTRPSVIRHRGRSRLRTVALVAAVIVVAFALLAAVGAMLEVTDAHTPAKPARVTSPRPLPTWERVMIGASDLGGDAAGVVVLRNGSRVTALDPSGHDLWSTDVEGAGHSLQPPALDATRVAVAADARLVVLDRGDGHVRWSVEDGSDVESVALAHRHGSDDLVLATTEAGELEGRAAADGSLRWRIREPGTALARLALDGDGGAVVARWENGFDPVLRVVDVGTGSVRWEHTLGIDTSPPVVMRDLVVVATGDGNYHASVSAFALGDGKLRTNVPAPASFGPYLEPATDGDTVFVTDHFGRVAAVDPVAGVERWHADLRDAVLRTRVVVGPRFVVVTTYAPVTVFLDRRTGEVVHRVEEAAGSAQPVGLPGQVVVARANGDREGLQAYRV
jgi:outer membrane protein assembly factor BamB